MQSKTLYIGFIINMTTCAWKRSAKIYFMFEGVSLLAPLIPLGNCLSKILKQQICSPNSFIETYHNLVRTFSAVLNLAK